MSETRSLLQDALRPGEKIVWTGRPQAWRIALPQAAPTAIVAASAGVWLLGVLGYGPMRHGAKPGPDESVFVWAFFTAIAIAVILISILVTLALLRSLLAAWRTHYAVTDRRAIILEDLWPRPVRSLEPAQLAPEFASRVGCNEATRLHGDGKVGTVVLIRPDNKGRTRRGTPVAFVGISTPHRVEQLIRKTLFQNQAAESATS